MTGTIVQHLDHMTEPFRARGVLACKARPTFDSVELRHEIRMQVARLLEIATAKAQPHDRIGNGPIPMAVDVESFEQHFVALKQFL